METVKWKTLQIKLKDFHSLLLARNLRPRTPTFETQTTRAAPARVKDAEKDGGALGDDFILDPADRIRGPDLVMGGAASGADF